MVDLVSQQKENEMLFANFNQDSNCFVIGTEKGYRIYNIEPFKELYSRKLDAGIGKIEMLDRSNILALVGGGSKPKYSPNKVIIWDEYYGKEMAELRFTSDIKNVKLTQTRIIVVCETKIFIFEITTCTKLETIETFSNPKGLISIRGDESNLLLAYPDSKRGYLRIKSSNNDIQDSQLINAHESSLACISFNREGTLICTASDKGTIIRVFTVQKGTLVRELRRGSGDAEIYSLSFSSDSKFLACSSDRGTIHVFILNVNIDEENEENGNVNTQVNNDTNDEPKNQKSFLSKISNFFGKTGGYFNSEWSFARIVNVSDTKTICSFRPSDKSLNIIGSNGRYYHAVFNLKSGGVGMIAEDFKLGL